MPQQDNQETSTYTKEQLLIYRLYVKYGTEQLTPFCRYVIRNLGFPFDVDNGTLGPETQVSMDFRKFLRQGNLTDNPAEDVKAFVTYISKDFLKPPRSLDQIYEDMARQSSCNQGRCIRVTNRNRLYQDTRIMFYSCNDPNIGRNIPYPYTTTGLRTMLRTPTVSYSLRNLYYKVLHGTYNTTDLINLKCILPHEYLGVSRDRYLARWCAYVYNFERNVIEGVAKASWLEDSLTLALEYFIMESCSERELVYTLFGIDHDLDLTDKEVKERMETLKELYHVVQLPRTDVIRVYRVDLLYGAK
jgi:hypothetical protein